MIQLDIQDAQLIRFVWFFFKIQVLTLVALITSIQLRPFAGEQRPIILAQAMY